MGSEARRATQPVRITVRGDAPYDVVIGAGLADLAVSEVPEAAGRVAILHPPTLVAQAEWLREALAGTGRTAIVIELPDGEAAKTASVAQYCWSVLGQSGFTRTDVVIGLGGGATTDLAGFVAATWLRGVPLIQIPTTILAMVDAAVGGKTGINTAEGKNLVGSFYRPSVVLCDLNTLTLMPPAEYVPGLAEVVKCGFIRDPVILGLIEADPAGARDPRNAVTAELVRRAVQVKADVVSDDFREAVNGPRRGGIGREVLNYGHTVGHAIERVENYRWRHGAAISVGMIFAAELGNLSGGLPSEAVGRHRSILSSLGLPISYESGRWAGLLEAMKLDKKTRADVLRFVVLEDIAKPVILQGPEPAILTAAYERISHR